MNDVQKMMFKNGLANNTLDIEKFFKEYNIELNLNNYKDLLDDILSSINEVRSEMYLSDLENLYPYQQLIANDIYRKVYEQILVNSKINKMPEQVFNDLKSYYKKFNSLAGAGALRTYLVEERKKSEYGKNK